VFIPRLKGDAGRAVKRKEGKNRTFYTSFSGFFPTNNGLYAGDTAEMDAEAVIEALKRRLLALADHPPFRFKQTSRTAAQWYMRRMTTFEGCSEAEIAAVEAYFGVQFTDVFRTYLRQMGKARGDLLCGSDVAQPPQFAEFRQFGQELMHQASQALELPDDAIVFLAHQGYQFTFIQLHGGFDCPVMNYMETEDAPKQIAESFAAFLDAEVSLMEENHRKSHETGGHYITVHRNGCATFQFPALASGDRPTSKPFKLGDWGRLA